MRKRCLKFLIPCLILINSVAWAATTKPKKKAAAGTNPPAGEGCKGQFSIPLEVLPAAGATKLAQALSRVFGEAGLVVKADKTTLCVAHREKASEAVSKILQNDLTGIVNLMDNNVFAGLSFNSYYVIHLKNLRAMVVETAFPHPAPGLDLHAPSGTTSAPSCNAVNPRNDCGTYLVLVPTSDIAVNPPPGLAKALTEQAAGIKHDLTQLDKLFACVSGDCPAADRLAEYLNENPNYDDSLKETEQWYAQHTLWLSVLNPRDVMLGLGDLFNRQQRGLKLAVLTKEHAVTILPSHVPRISVLRDAEAIERDVLYHQEEEDHAWFDRLESAGSNKAPKAGENTLQSANNGSGGNAGSLAGSNHHIWSPGRVVRLYYNRNAPGIAGAINGSSSGNPKVKALGNDLLLILPQTQGTPGEADTIQREITLLDLPRPQISLEVWSYQISGQEPKNQNKKKSAIGGKKSSKFPQAQDVQQAFTCFNRDVIGINKELTEALQRGFGAILKQAKGSKAFFDPTFQNYLTGRYENCVKDDHYCLGYYDALDVPTKVNESPGPKATDASLSRLILYLAAAKNAKSAEEVVINAMDNPTTPVGTTQENECCRCRLATSRTVSLSFKHFKKELQFTVQPSNLSILRAALLNFLFNYKWIYMYSNDFVPYDLESSSRTLDSLLNPIATAFDEDVDDYVQARLEAEEGRKKKVGFSSRGMVQVNAVSGTEANVTGNVINYFDITPSLSLNDILAGNSAKNSNGGFEAFLKDALTPQQFGIVQGLANIASKQSVSAEVSRGVTLDITPTALDTASSASLKVTFDVKDDDGTPKVTPEGSPKDLLDRVSDHKVTDQVRVDSLKLFDISTFSMDLSHPRPPFTIPVIGDIWKGAFGTVPVFGNLFQFPRAPVTKENRSVAIVRAVVVPTAMDLGLGLRFEADRVDDPVTNTTDPIHSIAVLGGNVRPFHKALMECIAKDNSDCWDTKHLSDVPEDLR